ncbi:hypothetical protein F4778DRAFT_267203 [Xylariomycetidae sp. FL2044]|nr:hypothetical protein F4778DRAFT_267203 [Xylariomycetidae sp. FL2044]
MATKIAGEEPGQIVFARNAQETFGVYDREARCDVLSDMPAVWRITAGRRDGGKLSAVAAHVLVQEGKVTQSELEPLMVVKLPDFASPGDPLSGCILAVSRIVSSIKADVKRMASSNGGKTPTKVDNAEEQEKQEVAHPQHHSRPLTAIFLGLLFLLLHILRAPLTLISYVLFGLYSLIDFVAYELGSHTDPDLFASNPRAYSLGQMLGFLAAKPVKELASVPERPAQLPLAILRSLLALLNIPVGLVALPLRSAETRASRLMGERPRGDVVAEARIRYGRLQAERLTQRGIEEGEDLKSKVIRVWDEKGEKEI